MDKTHAEQLQIYLEALTMAKELDNTYLYTCIQRMIATYVRQINRAYKRGLEDTDG